MFDGPGVFDPSLGLRSSIGAAMSMTGHEYGLKNGTVCSQTEAMSPVALFVGADAEYMYSFRANVISALRQAGYRAVVLATSVSGREGRAFADIGAEFVSWKLNGKGLNPLADIAALAALWSVMRTIRPNVVFSHTIKSVIYSMTLSRLIGVPHRVALLPGLGYAFTLERGMIRHVAGALATAAYSIALRSASTVIFQNPDDRAYFLRRGILPISANAVVVGGSGVDMNRFPLMPLPPGPITFLLVARLIRDKGIYDFIEAARLVKGNVPDARFVLVGGRDANPAAVPQSVIEQWRKEGIVEVRGHMEDPQPAYADCHVFVLPSYYREGLPRTILEAMSSGRAVITTDMPGCREPVINGVTGLLVPPQNPRALAKAMLDLAQDRGRIDSMGKAGRQLCTERFELGAVTRQSAHYIMGH